MANETLFDPRRIEAMVAVLQSMIEGELTNTTYGIARFLKQATEISSLPMPSPPQPSPSSDRMERRLDTLERLLDQVGTLVNQLDRRSQTIVELESRVMNLEESLRQDRGTDTHHESLEHADHLMGLDRRITALEESLDSFDLVAGEVGDRSETIMTLKNRITHLEQLLQRSSVIPQLVDQQGEAIITLEDRVRSLETTQSINPESTGYISEGDRF